MSGRFAKKCNSDAEDFQKRAGCELMISENLQLLCKAFPKKDWIDS